MVNFNIIFNIISRNLIIVGVFLFLCFGVAFYYHEPIYPFSYTAGIALLSSAIFFFLAKILQHHGEVQKKEAYIAVTLSWLIISLVGCLPYIFSGSIPDFTNAFFESVSGFTTTGSSILIDIEALPKSVLFWRSLTHWIGGIGIIVLFIIIMPTLNIGGYHLFTLESSLQDKIQPKIKAVGYRIMTIYVLLTLLEIIFLLLGGMNFYESVCHAFGTVATGGFSPKNTSIANYSPYIQYVITVFMLLAGVNFVIYYYIVKGNFKKVKVNEELKFYLTTVFVIGAVVTAILYFRMGKPLELAFREAYFQVVSIITCTGFASADYLLWPSTGWLIIFFAMFLGGSTGSTAGGIKMARHLILLKNLRISFRQFFYPNAIFILKINKNKINSETNCSIITFIAVYFIVFALGSIALAVTGLDGQSAASSAATAMAGIGPGLSTVGPVSNFAHMTDAAKLIMTLLMLAVRLEIYTLLAIVTPHFWKT